MKNYQEFVSSLSDGIITCQNCNWKWDIVTGGKDTWICHQCGHDNHPVQENIKPHNSE